MGRISAKKAILVTITILFLAGMVMESAFITKVSNARTDDGHVSQRVEMVFKAVKIEYKPQDSQSGRLGPAKTFTWDIPSGIASPSA